MLARTVDKARAQLHGGKPGRYYITPGLSEWLLRKLRFSEAEFVDLVAHATDETQIVAEVQERCSPERIAHLNQYMESFTVAAVPEHMRERFFEDQGEAPAAELVIDAIERDDRHMASARANPVP